MEDNDLLPTGVDRSKTIPELPPHRFREAISSADRADHPTPIARKPQKALPPRWLPWRAMAVGS